MSESVFEFEETKKTLVIAKGIQVSDEMTVGLLTSVGKKATLEKEEIADELADLKSVYNRLMVKLIKKADPESTITVETASAELEAKLAPVEDEE